MCGLCGEITFDGSRASIEALAAMTEEMVPRGPDAEGILARGRVAFGHRRLRIIDLSPKGEQPMSDPELGLTLVFNGCIYNHKDLRADLEALGYRFFSHSDTEVILKAWHAWGLEAPKRFHGMFAFVIHERESDRVVMCRDRLGIKPLYYAADGARLRFASTLPALLAAGGIDTSIDPVGLAFYMTFHAVVPPPHTIVKGVRKLPPATIRVIEPDGSTKDSIYWDLRFERSSEDLTESPAVWKERVGAALRLAVDRRMVADVPVGVLLSGGLDSSLIVGLLAEAGQKGLKTFSIGFEAAHGEEGDEFRYSDIVAERFGTDHTKIMVPTGSMLDALPDAIAAMSEPMVSYDNVGFFLLSKEVSRARQGGAERAGGRRGVRRLSLVPEARELERHRLRLHQAVLRPRPRQARNASCRPLDGGRRRARHLRRRASQSRRCRHRARPRAPHRRHRDAGRRSGEAGRQHDHGLGARRTRALSRP